MAGTETIIMDHEGRLSVIETTLKAVKEDVARNTTLTKDGFDKITDLLKGDNGDGLCTRVAVNDTYARDNIKRLWWAIPLLLTVATTVISYVLKYC